MPKFRKTRGRLAIVIGLLALSVATCSSYPTEAKTGQFRSAPARNVKCCPESGCILAGGSYHPSCK